MCLLIIAYKCRGDYPLVIAANRDEFFDRPAVPLGYWPDHEDILAGRDLRESGTWMGLHTSGRHGLDVFAPAAGLGVRTGSLHPLLPFPASGAPAAGPRPARLTRRRLRAARPAVAYLAERDN